jgi:hypothetical protein
MVVLPYTGALRYHNCCIDGTSPEYFGYTIVFRVQWQNYGKAKEPTNGNIIWHGKDQICMTDNQDKSTDTYLIYCGVCYNERMLQRTDFINKIRMLQRTDFINKIRMLQRTNATTNECYNERMLQRTDFINKIRMLQRTNVTTNRFYQ